MPTFEDFTNVPARDESGEAVTVTLSERVYPLAQYPNKFASIDLGPVSYVINACDDPRQDSDGVDSGASYIVYRSAPDLFRVRFAYGAGAGHLKASAEFNAQWARVRNLESLGRSLTEEERYDLSEQIGNAVGNGLDGDPPSMELGLDEARRAVWRISRRRGKSPYLGGLIGASLLLAVARFVMVVPRSPATTT